jgi:hypothetical protein
MKKSLSIGLLLISAIYCHARQVADTVRIDSIIAANAVHIKSIYQSEIKERLISLHDRKPVKDLVHVYIYNEQPLLVEFIEMSKAQGDTEVVIHYYYDKKKLVKVNTLYQGVTYVDSTPFCYKSVFYVQDDKFIAGPVDDKEAIWRPERHLENGKAIMKKFSKKPPAFRPRTGVCRHRPRLNEK